MQQTNQIRKFFRDKGFYMALGLCALAVGISGWLFVRETGKQTQQALSPTQIQAAAPADFTPAQVSGTKIKKDGEGLTLELVPTTDIAKSLGATKRPGQTFVIFAAETNDVEANARGKLDKKNADLVVANDVTRPGAGFGVDTNCVTLISRTDRRELPMMSKREVGDAILDRILELRSAP